MVWGRDFNVTTNSAGQVIDLLAGFRSQMGIARNLPGMTVTRVVGTHAVRVVSADDAFTRWIWGLGVWEVTNPPSTSQSALLDPDRDWMFVRSENVVQVVDAGTPTVKRVAATYDMDLHAQRKLDEMGKTLWYVADNPDGDNFDFAFNFNILLKLP